MAAPAETLDPYALWLHARSAVTSVQYPRRIAYTIAITGLDGEKPVADRYRAAYDSNDGDVRMLPTSDEQLAAPALVPQGANANLSIQLCWGHNGGCGTTHLPVGHPAPYEDLIGVPLLSPTYMFGIGYPAPMAGSGVDARSRLRVIATVSARSPEYRITLVDEPLLDGVATYHLELRPLRKPNDNRLRELWIGASDYLPRRAVVAGNFTTAPLVDVPWTIDFSVERGVPYLLREATPQTLYLAHRRVVRNAVIAFEGIHEPVNLYDMPLVQPEMPGASLVEP
jgi:hypothetical protein